MESKHDKFIRLAEQRTNSVINKIRLISNLSNQNNYEYEEEEVKEIFKAIDEEIKMAKQEFIKETKRLETTFKLTKEKD